MSILLKIHDEISRANDGNRDDCNPFSEAVAQLSEEDRRRYYAEAEFLESRIQMFADAPDLFEAARPMLMDRFGD